MELLSPWRVVRIHSLFAITSLLCLGLDAAPVVEKLDPPNWWAAHTWNPVQLLITGKELKGATVSSEAGEFRVEVRQVSEDGRYLFLYLHIGKGARPGSHRFRLTTPTGATSFGFLLEAPLRPADTPAAPSADDVIYLLMPDRFANGDPANDSPPEYGRPADRSSPNAYHGGDFAGIRRRLSYLKDLGVTALWMLPVYKNSSIHSAPPHGYHTVDFYAPEPRFGTMDELRGLVKEAQSLGFKVIQDQVANHCGPYHPWVEAPPTPTWFHDLSVLPRLRNNFDIAGLADPYARPKRRAVPLRGWFAGHLPDFDQTDPLAADYLVQNALWWIGMIGFNGIRQDTYPYADRPFWARWQSAVDRQFPGYWVVGEITARTPAVLSFFEGGASRYGVDTRLPTMLDFPLFRAIRAVFAQSEPMTQLTDVLAQDSLYQRPGGLVTFLGNHDVPRFLSLAGGDITRLLMAQAFLLTTRGVPHLYYGDEIGIGSQDQGSNRSMRADFPGGFPGDAVDGFTAEGRQGDAAVVFDQLRSLLHFRRSRASLRGGGLVQLLVERDRYGYLRSAGRERVLVLLNRGGAAPVEVEVDDLALPEGLRFQSWLPGRPEVAVAGGKIRLAQPEPVSIYWATVPGGS